MLVKDYLYKSLNTKKFFWILFSLNIIICVFVFYLSSSIRFPDQNAYLAMGESILNGKFSSWYFLPKYYPETLRTPGYPIFLAFCLFITKSILFIKIIQLIIFFVSLYLCILIIKHFKQEIIYRNIFLLFLIPNIQIVYYAGSISAETLSVFFVILTMFIVVSKKTLKNSILLAISCYCTFILRPAFLIFPFVLFVYFIFQNKHQIKFSILFIIIYFTLLIPFGLWNKYNHGIFKITTIEGAAGVAHLGFWQLKLPDGYTETYYWGNSTCYDYTKPKMYSIAEQEKNRINFEKECSYLLGKIKKTTYQEDTLFENYKKRKNLDYARLNNSKYTIEREDIIMQHTIKNILNEPFYYFKSRMYHYVRLYVSGINYKNLETENTFLGKLKVIYPFVITFTFIFLGLIYMTVFVIYKRKYSENLFIFVLLFLYYGASYMFFTIQARYTIPIHLLILAILPLTIYKNFNTENKQNLN